MNHSGEHENTRTHTHTTYCRVFAQEMHVPLRGGARQGDR